MDERKADRRVVEAGELLEQGHPARTATAAQSQRLRGNPGQGVQGGREGLRGRVLRQEQARLTDRAQLALVSGGGDPILGERVGAYSTVSVSANSQTAAWAPALARRPWSTVVVAAEVSSREQSL